MRVYAIGLFIIMLYDKYLNYLIFAIKLYKVINKIFKHIRIYNI